MSSTQADKQLYDLCYRNKITLSEVERLFAEGATSIIDGWCAAAYCLCFHRNVECLRAYLRLTPSDLPLNAGNSYDLRPVHSSCSAKTDDPRCLVQLLAAGAHPTLASTSGTTPLMYAAGRHGVPKPRIVSVLLSDPRVATVEHLSLRDGGLFNRTAQEWALSKGSEESAFLIQTALNQAVRTAASFSLAHLLTWWCRRRGTPSPPFVTSSCRLVKETGLCVGVRWGMAMGNCTSWRQCCGACA